MRNVVFILLFLLVTTGFAQKKIEVKNFSVAQKAEWDQFLEFWQGNGNGTCFPMMQTQMDSGKCMTFDFIANLTIGNDGKIKKAKLVKSHVLCEHKSIQKEVQKCFLTALSNEFFEFKVLKGYIILKAQL